MPKRTFHIAIIFATITFVGCDGSAGFLHHLHDGGHGFHGGHHQNAIAEVIEQLELTPEQNQRLETIHEIFSSYGSAGQESRIELHNQLVEQFTQGDLDAEEMRGIVDEHLEQMRGMAYNVTDELVALVDSLDATQRETLRVHLQGEDRADAQGD